MYAKRQMAYSERMRLEKQEWRVMHRLETRDDLRDLVETWDRIIGSISGSRPPSYGVSPGCLQKSDGSELPHFPNYNLSFPLESDNMNLFELVQDPPIMLVVAVVHNA